jgi:lysophospholipase L1-like esterase
MSPPGNPPEPTRPVVRIVGVLVVLVVLAAAIEGMARFAKAMQETVLEIPAVARLVNARMDIDSYKIPSDRHGAHWTLKPGFGADAQALIRLKQEQGRTEGAKAIAEAIAATGANLPLIINEDGFKGPAIDGAHRRPRLLILGDSVTFGYPGIDYVRLLDAELRVRGLDVECINGGVEGYALRNALLELPRYRALSPDFVIILLGWNDLFAPDEPHGTLSSHLASVRLLRSARRWIAASATTALDRANHLRNKQKHPDPAADEVARYRDYTPAFLGKMEALGDGLAVTGAKVVIATLPGLYLPESPPSARALEVGHLPEFTDNPFVLAAMTERTNQGYRALAARKGWTVADLDRWSRTAFIPRDKFFADSVHFLGAGFAPVAVHLADTVEPLIRSR